MFTKIAITALIIAVVFLLGRSSGMAERRRETTGPRKRRVLRRRQATAERAAVEDLVECPFCGAHVAASTRCRCRERTGAGGPGAK
ncbi:MAG: hypothetical protein AAF899_08360 [Pseudomonadota bacterium]